MTDGCSNFPIMKESLPENKDNMEESGAKMGR